MYTIFYTILIEIPMNIKLWEIESTANTKY